jgi:hypothetical protein
VKFILFVIDSTTGSASGNEMAAIDLFNDGLRRDGFWVMAAGIGSPDSASLIDNRSGADMISAGSLFAHTEHYSGFWIIDVPSREVATRVAGEGSRACNRRVELRPFLR